MRSHQFHSFLPRGLLVRMRIIASFCLYACVCVALFTSFGIVIANLSDGQFFGGSPTLIPSNIDPHNRRFVIYEPRSGNHRKTSLPSASGWHSKVSQFSCLPWRLSPKNRNYAKRRTERVSVF